jgi:hypothetical protein
MKKKERERERVKEREREREREREEGRREKIVEKSDSDEPRVLVVRDVRYSAIGDGFPCFSSSFRLFGARIPGYLIIIIVKKAALSLANNALFSFIIRESSPAGRVGCWELFEMKLTQVEILGESCGLY